MTKNKTLIAIPTMGWMRTELVDWVIKQQQPFIASILVSPVSAARNKLVNVAIENECEQILFVDSDTLPPDNTIEQLQTHIKGGAWAATGITPILREGKRPVLNVFKNHAQVEKPISRVSKFGGVFPVVGCGASCLLVPMSTFTKLKQPYFKAIEYDNGTLCSEDLYFCEQITKAGGEIIADPGVMCKHSKTSWLELVH